MIFPRSMPGWVGWPIIAFILIWVVASIVSIWVSRDFGKTDKSDDDKEFKRK